MLDDALDLQKRILAREPPLLYETCKVNNHFLHPEDEENCILVRKHFQISNSERHIEYSSPRSWIRLDEFSEILDSTRRVFVKYLRSNIQIFESEPQLPNLVIDKQCWPITSLIL